MLDLIVIIALAAQVPLLGLAFLAEFSRRKAHPRVPAELPVERPEAAASSLPPPVAAIESEPAPATVEAQPDALPPPSLSVEVAAPPVEVVPAIEVIAPPPAVAVAPIEPEPVQAEPPEPEHFRPELPQVAPVEPVEHQPLISATRTNDRLSAVGEPSALPSALTATLPAANPKPSEPARMGLGLRRTRENFLARIRAAITGSGRIDEIYEGLEEALIGADVGVETSLKIIEGIRERLKNDARAEVIRDALKAEIEKTLLAVERPLADSGDAPLVIMMAGVNGAGKTTTVAKLAARLKAERGLVVVAASDTFRAAAIEQLQVWCDRVGVDLIKQKQGSDPAAVAFDAVKAAIARKAAAVLIDTAGRLQTKVNLMEELKKIGRVIGRELPGAPHETWLVLDATTGQNALSQAKVFGDSTPLTGVVLAKLDSTAKGGVIVAIAERLKLPVRFIGIGEGIEDLREFNSREFVDALFSDADESSRSISDTYAA